MCPSAKLTTRQPDNSFGYSHCPLSYQLHEWLNLAFRWTHVFAGILWIGQTYFFTWLDHRLHEEGKVWMVHSGGFYVVEKQGVEVQPPKLHWFKWEAALTWLSGFFLLSLVYYHGGVMVDDSVRRMSPGTAAGLSIA